MRAKWIFSISYYWGESVAQPLSIGVQLSTPREVEEFADYLGIEIPGRNDPRHHSRGLRVELWEDDPKLHSVIQQIESRYGWKQSKWHNSPLEERSRYFGIRKDREYSKKDLDGAAFLSLLAQKPIAGQKDGTAEQVDAEVYIAETDRLQSAKTEFGALMPFHAKCITESLGRQAVLQPRGQGIRGHAAAAAACQQDSEHADEQQAAHPSTPLRERVPQRNTLADVQARAGCKQGQGEYPCPRLGMGLEGDQGRDVPARGPESVVPLGCPVRSRAEDRNEGYGHWKRIRCEAYSSCG